MEKNSPDTDPQSTALPQRCTGNSVKERLSYQYVVPEKLGIQIQKNPTNVLKSKPGTKYKNLLKISYRTKCTKKL